MSQTRVDSGAWGNVEKQCITGVLRGLDSHGSHEDRRLKEQLMLPQHLLCASVVLPAL